MKPRTKVLLIDGFLAVLCLVQVWLNIDDGMSWPLAALFTVTTVLATYAGEHGTTDRLPGSKITRTVALIVVLGAAILIGGSLLGPDLITSVLLAGLAGLGVGLLCYRAYFGLVRPVPAVRLERV
ncbi:hypothetical protein [Haloarcula amylovorans]|uniref:hypothetical protein n=1 Tax=Haloarcula amylovorans TaxID=2562280 RepID=UPI0010760234|nr:hypothetical protein [Halomicroarcula amylolytica]